MIERARVLAELYDRFIENAGHECLPEHGTVVCMATIRESLEAAERALRGE